MVVLQLVKYWFGVIENGQEVCTVFFDFRKALDSVLHATGQSQL